MPRLPGAHIQVELELDTSENRRGPALLRPQVDVQAPPAGSDDRIADPPKRAVKVVSERAVANLYIHRRSRAPRAAAGRALLSVSFQAAPRQAFAEGGSRMTIVRVYSCGQFQWPGNAAPYRKP